MVTANNNILVSLNTFKPHHHVFYHQHSPQRFRTDLHRGCIEPKNQRTKSERKQPVKPRKRSKVFCKLRKKYKNKIAASFKSELPSAELLKDQNIKLENK